MGIISTDNQITERAYDHLLTDDWLTHLGSVRVFAREFERGVTITEKWNALRRVYDVLMPFIQHAARISPLGQIDPYFVDWSKYFTPIEAVAWQSIRAKSLPFYPQYPVLNFYLDFADPVRKIGLELDGADYHNAAEDRARDERLSLEGWSVYRATGRECFSRYPAGQTEAWMLNTADGLLEAIYIIYYAKDYDNKHLGLALKSLQRHQLTSRSIAGMMVCA